MEGEKEKPGGEPSRVAKAARVGGYIFGALAALFLAAWVATLFMSRRPPREDGVVPAPESGAAARSAIGNESPEGYIRVRLRVSVMDAAGKHMPVGSALPESVALTMLDSDGRSYKAFFDKVGLWVVDVPPGTYLAPAAQASLGKWRWSLGGAGLKKDGLGGYTLQIKPAAEPPVLDLVLRFHRMFVRSLWMIRRCKPQSVGDLMLDSLLGSRGP